MKISPNTKVHELLKTYPFLEDFLVAYNPKFSLLKSKVMRATVGKVATMKMVAVIGEVDLKELISDIGDEVERQTGKQLEMDLEASEIEMDEKHMIQLLKLVESKKITETIAQKLLEKLIEKPFDVNEHIKKESLEAVSDAGEIEKFCKEAIKENPQAVEDYKKGEGKALNFIVGAVMRKTKGKASPKEVNEIILRMLKN